MEPPARPTPEVSPIGPGLCEAAGALLLIGLTVAPNSLLNGDGDTAHHLAVGHQILATGAVPLTDTFSHAHVGGTFI
ncbi:MAG TPA: hypothetical protein VM536_21410, partial [Chloroflexia bacterium]|nr:hypothetical protein [Chloroflexia bacterium]